ncbi:hypothetical protein [Paenibacillus nuruki]|uniref:hypothetical protein n=1 Tax=Paenibacillus nuruki TaxID=1886670 RepID=UPI00280563B5|nr:hypothetical protein [Paenibacillus nuruki]CAJ1316624.1 hypothetical protein AASFL403_15470 [Paenibacillus nuruki]
MKKTAIILSSLLGFSALAPTVFVAPVSASVTSEKSSIVQVEANEIFDALDDLQPYISIESNGLYKLDEKAKNVVSEEIFNKYKVAFDKINKDIDKGVLSTKTGDLTTGPRYELEKNKDNVITPNVFGNAYAWGYAITFNHAETVTQVKALRSSGVAGGLIAAITAAIPGLQPATVAAALGTAGVNGIAQLFENNDKGRGVTLNLHAGYFNFTSN